MPIIAEVVCICTHGGGASSGRSRLAKRRMRQSRHAREAASSRFPCFSDFSSADLPAYPGSHVKPPGASKIPRVWTGQPRLNDGKPALKPKDWGLPIAQRSTMRNARHGARSAVRDHHAQSCCETAPGSIQQNQTGGRTEFPIGATPGEDR